MRGGAPEKEGRVEGLQEGCGCVCCYMCCCCRTRYLFDILSSYVLLSFTSICTLLILSRYLSTKRIRGGVTSPRFLEYAILRRRPGPASVSTRRRPHSALDNVSLSTLVTCTYVQTRIRWTLSRHYNSIRGKWHLHVFVLHGLGTFYAPSKGRSVDHTATTSR